MEYTALGHNEKLRVSKIGTGLWQASNAWNAVEEDVIEAVGTAKEKGINFLDTAEAYGKGNSERVLGKALKEYGRENFFVATKVAGAHLRYDELQRAASASIKRLGVDYIDLYQIHWPDPWEQIPMSQTFRAMKKLHEEGKIRAVGVSNFAVRDMEEARGILGDLPIVSNQVRYNLLQRNIEEEVVPFCKKNNISIIAWSPLAQGVLTGKYSPENIPNGDVREGNELFAPKNLEKAKEILSMLKSLGEKYSKTPAQIALNWLASKKDVIPIPGAKNSKQAMENADSVSFKLTGREISEMESLSSATIFDYLPA
ncbi:MAG: aldo/keto reductase [Candidatus Thermoplasmatota archaeon]|nr:aldo/keto reductase [Candidatus Thermoplasmatota archaeon]MCL5889102.1 aldo/keto reductase [Candidatus Thermoplasmatota archaeon]